MSLAATHVQPATTVSAERKEPFFFEKSRLMVIAINATNQNLIYRAQTKPNGPWEADWSWVNKTNTYASMATGVARDGRVVAVAQTTGTPLVHFYIETPEGVGKENWEPPVNLGMPPGVSGFKQLETRRGANGKVQVFGLAANTGNVWWTYQNPDRLIQKEVTRTPPGTTTPITVTVTETAPPLTPWSNWQALPPRRLDVMTAANNGDGTIVLAGSAFDNATYHVYYIRQKTAAAAAPSDWTAWLDLTKGELDADAPTARLDLLGNLNIFARGQGGAPYTRQMPAGTDNFTRWALPFWLPSGSSHMATGIDGDGHIVLIVQDAKGNTYINTMSDAELQIWSGWQQLSVGTIGPMAMDYNSDGRLTLFVRDTTPAQQLWCLSQIAYNSSAWEARWTLLSQSALSRYGVVRDLTPPASTFA
jgi:hypothetical protein